MTEDQETMQFTCEKCGRLKEGSLPTMVDTQELCWDCASKGFWEAAQVVRPPAEAGLLTPEEIKEAAGRPYIKLSQATGRGYRLVAAAQHAKDMAHHEPKVAEDDVHIRLLLQEYDGFTQKLASQAAQNERLVAALSEIRDKPISMDTTWCQRKARDTLATLEPAAAAEVDRPLKEVLEEHRMAGGHAE